MTVIDQPVEQVKMKKTLIKSAKKLPSWFKLENYNKAKYFNSGEWYDELTSRFALLMVIDKQVDDPLNLPERWEFIKKNGLLFYSAHRENVKYRVTFTCPQNPLLSNASEKICKPEDVFISIESLRNMYVYMSLWLLDIPEREKIIKKLNHLINYDHGIILANLIIRGVVIVKCRSDEASEWAAQIFDDFPSDVIVGLKNKFAYARVKLDASDEQIKKDFSLWLDQERKRRNCPAPKKNFSDVDMSSWYSSGVLPYLDLMYWSGIENIKIAQHVIAQTIFPDAYSVESNVDALGKLKTTKKKADYLMSDTTLKLLELQIEE